MNLLALKAHNKVWRAELDAKYPDHVLGSSRDLVTGDIAFAAWLPNFGNRCCGLWRAHMIHERGFQDAEIVVSDVYEPARTDSELSEISRALLRSARDGAVVAVQTL